MEDLGLKPKKTIVKVISVGNFTEYKVGIYLERCKKDGGYKVYLTDKDFPIREVCIVPDRGDVIVSISKD